MQSTKFKVQMSPNRKRRSGSFSSWSLGSFFGLDDDDEEDIASLSEFQQQSLSVFESEHMWAHFKAHLKESNIQTAAGVRAMLPKFVDERVKDGSVISSERLVYPSSMRHQETFGANSIAVAEHRPVYPAAMRRQESFGMNKAIYGQLTRRQSSSRSIASSDQSSLDASGHSLCAYENVLRGDRSAFGLCGEDKDLSLLANVGKRLKKKTSRGDNADRPFSQTSAYPRKSALRNNSSGIFSTWSEDRDCDRSNAEVVVVSSPLQTETTSRRLSAESNTSGGSRRPKFRRASISSGEDIPITYGEQMSSNGQNLPGRTPQPETISSDMSALLEETLLLYSPINNKRNVPASKVETSYRPVRKETLNHKNANDRSVPSLASSSTGDVLLVEWGEDGESSDDEKSDDKNSPCSDDSEKAVVISRQELIEGTLNHDDDDDDDENNHYDLSSKLKSPNVIIALLSSISLKNEQ